MKNVILFIMLMTVSGLVEAQQERSYREKAEFMRHHPCPSTGKVKVRYPCPSTGKVKVRYGCKGYVIDHIDPLACGGEDKAYNMQWQAKEDAKLKDKWERKNCH